MIGAIIGDIVGSRFEWHNIKSKQFELFTDDCFFTDDSIMTIAIGKALMECKGDYVDLPKIVVKYMQEIGRNYPDCGYGGNFYHWIYTDNPKPYNSFGNGAAMRVSSCGIVGKTETEVKHLAKVVTQVSHNHPEGLKAAEATALAIYYGRTGKTKEYIYEFLNGDYYDLDFTLEDIRPSYGFDVTCQGTMPVALVAFFESTSFEDAIRNAVSVGGDSDTIAAITGSIAAAYYGVPQEFHDKAIEYLDSRLSAILTIFEKLYLSVIL